MKRRETLTLIEIIIMIGIFAIAAGLCLQIFAAAGKESMENTIRDRSIAEARNTAELLSCYDGDFDTACAYYGGRVEEECWVIRYDVDWNITENNTAYMLTVRPEQTDSVFLGKASITVTGTDGNTLFSLTAAWQMGDNNEE